MITIQDATHADMPAIMALIRYVHAESIFKDLPFDESKAHRTAVTMMAFDKGYAKLAVRDGVMLGGMCGIIAENYVGVMCASDILMYAKGGTKLLVEDFIRWSKENGAQVIQLTDFSKGDRYGKLLTKIGLKPQGLNYIEVQ